MFKAPIVRDGCCLIERLELLAGCILDKLPIDQGFERL